MDVFLASNSVNVFSHLNAEKKAARFAIFADKSLWYSCAMIPKGLRVIPVLLVLAAPLATSQTVGGSAIAPQSPAAPAGKVAPNAAPPTGRSDCNGGACEDQQPRVIVSVPTPQPAPWRWQDRVEWAAIVALPILLYVGMVLALATLKKIERQTRALEEATRSIADHAQAALLNAQAIVDAERPWLLIGVEPSYSVKDGFNVTVSNRGRMPAQIVATLSQTTIAVDEALLPKRPEYDGAKPAPPLVSTILVPGESMSIKTFSRDEVAAVCGSNERLKRVEEWEEKIFLYGKVIYRDLIARSGQQNYETAWCCWYIHGRQKSGMTIAGPPEYNVHT